MNQSSVLLHPKINNQRGAILIISILVLMMMTLLGLAIFQGSFLESKVQYNNANISEAAFANNIAMSAGTQWVNKLTQNPNTCSSSPCCSGCVWQQGALQPTPNWFQNANVTVAGTGIARDAWWASNGNQMNPIGNAPAGVPPPQYVIEQWSCDEATQTRFFRVVARGDGLSTPPTVITSKIVSTTKTIPKPQQMVAQTGFGFVTLKTLVNNINVVTSSIPPPAQVTQVWLATSSNNVQITIRNGLSGTITYGQGGTPFASFGNGTCPSGTGNCFYGYLASPYRIGPTNVIIITVVDMTGSSGFVCNPVPACGGPTTVCQSVCELWVYGVTTFCH